MNLISNQSSGRKAASYLSEPGCLGCQEVFKFTNVPKYLVPSLVFCFLVCVFFFVM